MTPRSNPGKPIGEQLPRLPPFDILLIILDYLPVIYLLAGFRDYNAISERSEATKTALSKAQDASKPSFKAHSPKACADSLKAANEVQQDILEEALLIILLKKLPSVHLNMSELMAVNNCLPVVLRLRETNLYPYSGDYIPLLGQIRKQNPNAKWNLEAVSGRKLMQLSESEALEELNGSLDTQLNSRTDLSSLNLICEKCHSDLGLDLEVFNDTDDVRVQDLDGCTSILKHLMKLRAKLYRPVSSKKDFYSLNEICKNFKFKLDLNLGNNWRALESLGHAFECLVALDLRSPTRDAISWLYSASGQREYKLALHNIDNVLIASDCVRSRWTLTDLSITNPLVEEEEVILFKQIWKANPDMNYNFTLGHASLLSLLHDIPIAAKVSLCNPITCHTPVGLGWEINCNLNHLHGLLGLNLSCLRLLEVVINNEHELDPELVTPVFEKCPNLEELEINTDSRDKELRNLPETLQELLDGTWMKLQMLTITHSMGDFSSIVLPGFNHDDHEGYLTWRRNLGCSVLQ